MPWDDDDDGPAEEAGGVAEALREAEEGAYGYANVRRVVGSWLGTPGVRPTQQQ